MNYALKHAELGPDFRDRIASMQTLMRLSDAHVMATAGPPGEDLATAAPDLDECSD